MAANNNLPAELEKCWPIEKRVLAFLDQHGATHRQKMVADLASPGSRIGDGHHNGSNSFIPAIAVNWCKRLVANGLIIENRDKGFHRSYQITLPGRKFLREGKR